MTRTTMGRALLDHALPPALRRPDRVLDKKGTQALFDDLARDHPDAYRETSKRLLDVARDVAYGTAGFSFGLDHLRPTPAVARARARIEHEIAAIQARRDLDPRAKEEATVAVLQAHQKPVEEAIFGEALAAGNPLAQQVLSGSRGNKTQLKGLLAGDYLYEDHRGRPIAIPALTPYAQGLRPVEYWAAGYGARKGVKDVKFQTAQAGYLAKQLNQITHRLVVTEHDDHREPAPGSVRGLPVAAADPDNVGALLAHPAGAYPRNTVLTPKVLADLKNGGHDRILVRSPTVGGPRLGGVFARDVGVRERGGLAPRGDYVGLAAAQSLAEKITQSQLSSRHTGGVAGAGAAVSGFGYINSLVQVPATFPGGATHAQVGGTVDHVGAAPQGGTFVTVAGKRHYLPPGLDPAVAAGAAVEPGDLLSAGIPNPAELVRHKGVGAGRAHFVDAFMAAYRNSGLSASRRNVELLARGLIDHVRVTEEHDGFVPDDVVPYSAIERDWEPRPGARTAAPASALGKYLEAPVLHHTIGTRVTRSMLPDLGRFGVEAVTVHDDPPPFAPEFVRGAANLQNDPDWMTRHLGSNLSRSTLEAVHRGRTSDTAGTSYVPAIAERGTFGQGGPTRGWDPPRRAGPRDGDDDGRIRDGTPHEAPAGPGGRRTAPRRGEGG